MLADALDPEAAGMSASSSSNSPPVELAEVAVIGMGFAGLSVVCRLKKAGVGPLVAFEKGDKVGGTWAANTYPGCACDVPSHLYSLSFASDFEWSRQYATQPEILAYLEHVARKHKLTVPQQPKKGAAAAAAAVTPGKPIVRLNTEVREARWDAGLQLWVVEAVNHATGESSTVHARFLICCLGRLAIPAYPDIPGADTFAGPAVHTARWDPYLDLKGKRVAVIGTGASAIQAIPEIAKEAGHLTVFQRSPPYVLPKLDYSFSAPVRKYFRYVPFAHLGFRNHLFLTLETTNGILTDPRNSVLAPLGRWIAARHLARQVRKKKPELIEKLTPRYPMGCKRILISNSYYAALAEPHVDVVTSGIQAIKPPPSPPSSSSSSSSFPLPEAASEGETKDERGDAPTEGGGGGVVVDGEGKEHPVDVLVYATGFQVRYSMDQVRIVGADGLDLQKKYREQGFSSYLGVATAGMPNFLMTQGSNTTLGHQSVVFMIERNTDFIVSFIKQMRASKGAAVATLKPGLEEAYMDEMARRVERSVWNQASCQSYYMTARDGGKGVDGGGGHRRPASDMVWPGNTFEYWRRTWRANLRRQFDVVGEDGRPLER